MTIPVIDLFAGPGGLGEGFSKSRSADFKIAISIEKDGMAHETLRLRAAHRELQRNPRTTKEDWHLWDQMVEAKPWNILFSSLKGCESPLIREACKHAELEAHQLELGPSNREEVSKEIRKRLEPYLKGGKLPNNAVLIGGPPCQAYSVVGRSRNKGTKQYVAEKDHRHFLYEEYLHVIAEFRPAVFVMENVKGILSSRVDDGRIFERIMADLKQPGCAELSRDPVEYILMPLGTVTTEAASDPTDFILKAEEFGIPQARHRVIIVGIRKDVHAKLDKFIGLKASDPPSVHQVLGDLPAISPQISRKGQGMTWLDALSMPIFDQAIRELTLEGSDASCAIAAVMSECRDELMARQYEPGSGGERTRIRQIDRRKKAPALADWYRDRDTSLLTNHESRAHMPSDLVRYMFVSAFGKVTEASPRLADFPKCLLPAHKNVDPDNVKDSIFKDRFRVQVGSRHSMTVTSHIAKDGHAFIHYKPKQCRSLSVREAARLQTFPDTYVFLGNRTSQYTQVGNAVPPKLANQIADVVARVLNQAGLT
ncbi:DNA cytosine methyltransferase [Pelomonas sp. APW6]|uniref:DNA (cytosine-5-)-methyltransferase n=1 Tax=Roseateles subflavus TaxID=3053353 RepID=A0ABT7LDN6_9BURK|nr:DNA cytosine methyltransferase [Pelomonas sp. APW6]MDL5030962.1 DNA cytosine methyltransferase [Pelomonas sp. APW6]